MTVVNLQYCLCLYLYIVIILGQCGIFIFFSFFVFLFCTSLQIIGLNPVKFPDGHVIFNLNSFNGAIVIST